MAAISSSEFSRGGVTWDDGFIWKVSEGLVGGLGMRRMEYWAGTAGTGSGTSPKTNKGKKNRRQLRSTAVNISNTLSSPSTTDPAASTIITVPVSGGGGGSLAGVGVVEAEVYVSCFKSSSERFFETVRSCGLLVVGYFLWVLFLSVGKGEMAARGKKATVGKVPRTDKMKMRTSLPKQLRALRRKLWGWALLVVLVPWVFLKELWLSYFLTAHYGEEYFETGIYNRGVGGITLVPVDGTMGEGGRVVERGRGGRVPGGGKKIHKPSVCDRVWKVVNDRSGDLKLTLNAVFALVIAGLAWVFLLPDERDLARSGVFGVAGLVSSEEEDDGSNTLESEAEGSGKGGKDNKKSPKKADNVGGQRRKGGGGRGGGGGKKKGKKR